MDPVAWRAHYSSLRRNRFVAARPRSGLRIRGLVSFSSLRNLTEGVAGFPAHTQL
jgi:hypothetical protein